MKTIFTLFLSLGCLVATAQDKSKLPSVELTDINGAKINIQDFAKNGKVTVINFWATWCAPCKKELNNIKDLYADWKDEYDMEIIAVSIDDSRSKSKVKVYVDGQRWDYTVLLDANQDLKRALNFVSIPYTIIVDKEGSIVYRHSGYVEGDEYELEEKIAKIAG